VGTRSLHTIFCLTWACLSVCPGGRTLNTMRSATTKRGPMLILR
jgi:hypothetical protein